MEHAQPWCFLLKRKVENIVLSSKKILLVEDDATLGAVTKNALEKRGYLVVHKTSVNGARDVISSEKFDIAILDLKLAEETSLCLIPDLNAHNQSIKILMLTAYASIATAVEAVKRGADNYLPKPANISEILNVLGESDSALSPKRSDIVMSPKRLEWEHIQRVLMMNDGNVSATARELNMHRRTLQRKLQKKPVKD